MKATVWTLPAGVIARAAALLSLVAVGCAGQKTAFKPASSETTGPGESWAYYELKKGETEYGQAKVWTQGAYRPKRDGQEPVIQIGLRIRNDSDQELTLDVDRTSLEFQTTGDKLVVVEDLRVEGRTTFPPNSVQYAKLFFTIPEGTKRDEINSFELIWYVQSEDDFIANSTTFVRMVEKERVHYIYRDAYWPYADPRLYRSWAFSYWYRPYYGYWW